MLKYIVACLLFASAAFAQSNVTTNPSYVGSTNLSGSIGTTNTFQSLSLAVVPPNRRNGCLIQDNGSNTMYVFFGPIGSATKAASYQLIPPGTGIQGGSVSCATGGGGVLQDQISITGTSGDAFAASTQ